MTDRQAIFHQEKETKNTWRYKEQPEDDKPVMIGPLYIQKSTLGDPAPKTIKVTISFEETSDTKQ